MDSIVHAQEPMFTDDERLGCWATLLACTAAWAVVIAVAIWAAGRAW